MHQALTQLDVGDLRRLALVATLTGNSVVIANAAGEIDWVNAGFTKLSGYTLEEVRGRRPGSILQGPKTDPLVQRIMHDGLSRGEGFKVEVANYRKDRSEFWIAMDVQPVRDEAGTVINYIGIGIDITERKIAEAALAAAHAENELLLATISTALIGLDLNENISRWNAAAERIFGLPWSAVMGKPLGEAGLMIDWGDLYVGMNACLAEGRPIDVANISFRRADEREGLLDVNIVSSWSAGGDGSEGLAMILMATEVTERKQIEVQRQQGQKMESVGQLAAGVAHEINTPIQFVGDNLRFLADSFNSLAALVKVYGDFCGLVQAGTVDPASIGAVQQGEKSADVGYLLAEIPQAIAQSQEGVARVSEIVRAMKEFSHPDVGDKRPIDLNRAIQTTMIVARSEYKYVAEVSTDLASDLPAVPCIAGEFNQVLLNLLVNAAHAIAEVTTRRGGRGHIAVSTRRDGDHVEVRISDTGTGIPEKVRARIFDPFFTTKEVGKGTGQGLYIAQTVVVKKHGGSLTFETKPDVGTTFIVRLPLVARTA